MLLRAVLVRLRRDTGGYDPAQLPGLATTVLDLVTMQVAEQLHVRVPETRCRT